MSVNDIGGDSYLKNLSVSFFCSAQKRHNKNFYEKKLQMYLFSKKNGATSEIFYFWRTLFFLNIISEIFLCLS